MSRIGVLDGLAVTIKHFWQSAVQAVLRPRPRGRLVRQMPLETERGVFTVQYPEERLALPERARCLPMLVADSATGELRCTACGICARVCPPQAIWIARARKPEGQPLAKAEEFVVEGDVCMSCGLCAEYCPSDSIEMNHVYELATYDRESLTLTRTSLTVPEEYHARLHPEDFDRERRERRQREQARQQRAAATEDAPRRGSAVGPTNRAPDEKPEDPHARSGD